MKKIYIFIVFILSGKFIFSQELPPSLLAANPQEIKNLMGKNISEGKNQYEGINSVFTLKLKGLKEENHFKNFDEGMIKNSGKTIFSLSIF